MNTSINVDYWFPTPVWHAQAPDDIKNLCDHASSFALSLPDRVDGVAFSNIGGWQSVPLGPEYFKDSPVEPIIKYCSKTAQEIIPFYGITAPCKAFTGNIWVNINKKNDSNALHDHPGSDFVGIFYLTENNSDIMFKRLEGIDTYHTRSIKSNFNTIISHVNVTYKPLKGMFLLFPPWLLHEVHPNPNDDPRVSIAFNFRLKWLPDDKV